MKPGSPVAALDWELAPYRFNIDWFVPPESNDPPMQ